MFVYSTNDLMSPLASDRDEEYTPGVAGGRDAGPAAWGGGNAPEIVTESERERERERERVSLPTEREREHFVDRFV